MTRYFFHVQDGDEILRDTEGTELRNADLAYQEGVRSLGELARDTLHVGADQRHITMEVRDEGGVLISEFTLTFGGRRVLGSD